MPKRLAWEKNWLHTYGWSWDQIAELEDSDDLTPVEYLTGHAPFADFVVEVNRHVLIPRPETEKLVALVLRYLADHPLFDTTHFSIVDVGTGSGVIALALARQLVANNFRSRLLATDLSLEALALAQRNFAVLAPANMITTLQSDLLASVEPKTLASNWLLVANLPYIPTPDYLQLESNVRDFEPRLALDGGEDGWQLIERLLTQALALPTPPAAIFLEIDPSHAHYLQKLTSNDPTSVYHWQVVPDRQGLNRYLIAEKPIL
ncbi:peptide chain release factor N(5)-glutamine methyltransferase [bacterium]|nr:peptide chain release factor N(5)-glutamine methyltransferase [bacterium]